MSGTWHGAGATTVGARRRWWLLLAMVALVAAACGGDDDAEVESGASDPEATTGDVDDVAADDLGEADAGEEADGSAGAEDPAPEEPSVPGGTGTLVADLCNGGQFVDGAISIDDLVGWGVLSTVDVEISGGGPFDANAYNDFGSICNIDAPDGEQVSVTMSNNVGAYEGVAERSPVAVGEEGNWKWALSDGLETVVMEHTDADGVIDTFGVLWFPSDDARKNPEEVQRVFLPLIDAIIGETTVDIERIAPPATPDWFVCDDANGGVAGLDPATLLATAGYAADRGVSVAQDTGGFFGFTECTSATEVGLDSVTVQVQDSGADLQDTLDTFLQGWPEAVVETVAGYEVAFLEARAFTVVGDTPTEIRILVTDPDVDADFRAVVEFVLSSIG